MENIRENISTIKGRIFRAAQRAGRNPEEVTIVAVTKTVDVERIRLGIEAGLKVFGESRVQEAEGKIAVLAHENIKWHFIGHLQTNKAKKAIELFDLIHSVDSFHLLSEIEKRAAASGKNIKLLLQVNLVGEEAKFGFSKKGLFEILDKIYLYKNVSIHGLMAIPPWSEDPEDSRIYYRQMAAVEREISEMTIDGVRMEYLSMGMSNDFEIAIEEGANMIRIGTAIFGARR